MGINNVGPNASRLSIVLQHRQLTDEHTMEFCERFLKQANLLTKRGIDVHIDTFDLSNNNIGDKGLAKIASIIRVDNSLEGIARCQEVIAAEENVG